MVSCLVMSVLPQGRPDRRDTCYLCVLSVPYGILYCNSKMLLISSLSTFLLSHLAYSNINRTWWDMSRCFMCPVYHIVIDDDDR